MRKPPRQYASGASNSRNKYRSNSRTMRAGYAAGLGGGKFRCGGLAGTRTLDQCLKRALLYQLSYQPAGAREISLPHQLMQDFSTNGNAVFDFIFGTGWATVSPSKPPLA